ncbi:unnamed protein product [Trichobilharzia szidati]|nr:unnamed protein product [Trichobilharzia szidati]
MSGRGFYGPPRGRGGYDGRGGPRGPDGRRGCGFDERELYGPPSSCQGGRGRGGPRGERGYDLHNLLSIHHFNVTRQQIGHVLEGSKTEIRMPPRELRSLTQQVASSFPDTVVYDGGHAIYSEDPLTGVTTDPVEKEMEIEDPLGRDRLLLKYRIMEVQRVSTSDVDHFIKNPKATSMNMPQESIRLLDCILKTVSRQSFVSVGRSALFEAKPIRVVADKLFSIHKGFISSVRPQWKVRVNLDMTCKAYFTSENLALLFPRC